MKFLNLITLFSAAILLINSATLHAEDTSALATVPVTVYEQIDSAKTQVPSTQPPSTQTISRNNDSSSNKPIKHDELNVLFIPGLSLTLQFGQSYPTSLVVTIRGNIEATLPKWRVLRTTKFIQIIGYQKLPLRWYRILKIIT